MPHKQTTGCVSAVSSSAASPASPVPSSCWHSYVQAQKSVLLTAPGGSCDPPFPLCVWSCRYGGSRVHGDTRPPPPLVLFVYFSDLFQQFKSDHFSALWMFYPTAHLHLLSFRSSLSRRGSSAGAVTVWTRHWLSANRTTRQKRSWFDFLGSVPVFFIVSLFSKCWDCLHPCNLIMLPLVFPPFLVIILSNIIRPQVSMIKCQHVCIKSHSN